MSGPFTPLLAAVGRALGVGAARGAANGRATRVPPVPQIPLPQPPSVDVGLEAATVEQLLADNADLIGRIKICYGRDRAAFEREVLHVIRQYAGFVNALPATADNIFSDVGGLFKLGLEVGFYSLQGSDSFIVSGKATISARRVLEPRWRFGCFLAGLTSELHRTLNQVIVTDEGGAAWPHYLGPLTTWLRDRGSRRLFIRWLKDRPESRATALFALPHVLPTATMTYLSESNSTVVPHMLACISGIPVPGEPNAITEVVRRASAAVLNRETESNIRRFGRQIHGAHLERYLIDAMRQLVATSPAWQPNGDRSRVWIGKEGLFVVWPNAAEDMRRLLEDDEIPGIPRSADTIREILQSAGFFDPLPDGGDLWQIAPPGASTALTAVRVSSPALLTLRDAPPIDEDLPTLLRPAGAAPPNAATPSPAKPVQEARPRQAPEPSAAQASPPVTPPAQTELALVAPAAGAPPAATTAVTSTPIAENPQAAAPAVQPLSLEAPFTLHLQVSELLERAVAAFDPLTEGALQLADDGLFVALDVFREAGLDARAALRSLGDAEMVVLDQQGDAVTVPRRRAGAETQGVVIKPEFLRGWVARATSQGVTPC